jgi:hypothetical protein
MAARADSYAIDDPDILWVRPSFEGRSTGAYQSPFTQVSHAVKEAAPGRTIVLCAGDYHESVTVEQSGTISSPIRIVAEPGAENRVTCRAGWYFYDVSDLIVSGISFCDIPRQAVSVVGRCERNCFSHLYFYNCGLDTKSGCTFFFGGSGARCNIVEHCSFSIEESSFAAAALELPVGIMISEGDADESSEPNVNHIFRRNTFVRYRCGIIIGTSDSYRSNYGHIIEFNRVEQCAEDGIRVKCGDTQVRANLLTRCGKNGIFIMQGTSDLVLGNRIEHCETGIRIEGPDCSVINNYLLGCSGPALSVAIKSNGEKGSACGTFIEQNTMIGSGAGSPDDFHGIHMASDAYCVIRRNLYDGSGCPHRFSQPQQDGSPSVYIEDNLLRGNAKALPGWEPERTVADLARTNDSDRVYGASGWMACEGELPAEESGDTDSYRAAVGSAGDLFCFSAPDREYFSNSLIGTGAVEQAGQTGSPERDDDGIIDFSDWDKVL